MTLLLLRHGESEGNALHVIQGWRGYALTSRGRAQADAAGRHLASVGAVALYTSPLLRARETAAAVEAHSSLAAVELADLREYHFGEAEGLRWEEATARWGLSDRDWGAGRVPGEEGMPNFRRRVAAQFDALSRRHASELAICVVHGGVIGAIVAHLCGLDEQRYAQIYTGNCGITAVEAGDGGAVITGFNDQCHLRDAEVDAPL